MEVTSPRVVRAGTQGRNLREKPERNAAHKSVVSQLPYIVQNYLLMDGATSSGVVPPL